VAVAPVIQAARGDRAGLQSFVSRPAQGSEWHELALVETMGDALALAALGRVDEAVAKAAPSMRELVAINSASAALYLIDAVEIILQAEEPDQLVETLPDSGVYTPKVLGMLLQQARAMVDARAGETDRALAGFAAALEALRLSGAVYLLARCQYHCAALLGQVGRGEEAAPLLREAHARFRTLRAGPWVERVEALLEPVPTP
jgi:hypothetical protein